MKGIAAIVAHWLVWLLAAGAVQAQESTTLDELAKLKQNPLSGLRQVTLQNQLYPNFHSTGQTENVLSVQVIWPVSLGNEWSIVTYTILPVISQPGLEPGDSQVWGLGDTTMTLIATPKKIGTLIWGAGAVIGLPTRTNSVLGSDRMGAGPALALFVQPGPWTLGVLLENIWSFGGSGNNEVNQFSAQYWVTYNLPQGWFLQSNATITANWEADAKDRWTVPVSAGFGKVFNVGKQSVSASVLGYYNTVGPRSGSDWSVSCGISLLFP